MNPSPLLGLGLDAGGTQTRWALATPDGAVRAEGFVAALSGLQLHSAEGRSDVERTLAELARALAGRPVERVVAGVTGLADEQASAMGQHMADALGLALGAVRVFSDIELASRIAFAPGAGYLVYAGTGSVAAFVDEQGLLQRAGGRGAVIDDAGGGHWIASQALRRVWRAEDETPGAWQQSVLAKKLFEQIGGSNWAQSRRWVYGASRGELGTLALAVALAAAAGDTAAEALFEQAGQELARLALALARRYGPRPVALAGRVFALHPGVEAALRGALPPGTTVKRLNLAPEIGAARLAACAALSLQPDPSSPKP